MTLQFMAFGLTVLFGLQRLPAAIRGENRGMFAALFLMAFGMALSIPFIYLTVDSLLGGVNVANLLLRFSVLAAFLILGTKLAGAFNAPYAQRLIAGPVGFFVLALAAVAVTVLFLLSDLPESSAGLRAYEGQDTVAAYGDLARLYQSYVAACLAPVLFVRAADSRMRTGLRISAGLMSLGMSAVIVHTLLSLAVLGVPRGAWDQILAYGAVLVVSIGLALIWKVRRMEKRKPRSNLLAFVYGSR